MKSSYPRMMEQIALDDRARQDILTRLEEAAPRKRRPRVLKAALLAACVCLVLAGTILASNEFLGIRLLEIQPRAFTVKIDGVKSWSQEDFGQQMMEDLTAGQGERSDLSTSFCFDTWEELTAYAGLPLADNPVLDAGTERFFMRDAQRMYPGEDAPDGVALHRYCLQLHDGGEGIIRHGSVLWASRVDGVRISAEVQFFGLFDEHDYAANYSWTSGYTEKSVFQVEEYPLSTGTCAKLIWANTEDGEAYSCETFFVRENNLYHLHFHPDGQAVPKELVCRVLDGFI